MSIPKTKVGRTLRRLRRARGLSQPALGRAAGLHRQTIAKIEGGDRRSPASDTLWALARALGVSVDELLGSSSSAA